MADDDADRYICVSLGEAESHERIELMLEENGLLPVDTLKHCFPGAQGLKFKNTNTGAWRALSLDAEAKNIRPPAGGWGTDRLYIATRPELPSAPSLNSSGADSDSRSAQKRANTTTDSESSKRARLTPPYVDNVKQEEEESTNTAAEPQETQLVGAAGPIGQDPEPTCDLIVLNLSFQTTADSLTDYFQRFGEVQAVEVKKDFQTNKPKGFGFVHMKDIRVQRELLRIYEHTIDDRTCQVKVPDSKADRNPRSSGNHRSFGGGGGGGNVGNSEDESYRKRIYVGRIPPDMDREAIRVFFEREAKMIDSNAVLEQVLMPDPPRGFCFVLFNLSHVARRIIERGSLIIDGRSVAVGVATPKAPSGGHSAQQRHNYQQPSYNRAAARNNGPDRFYDGVTGYGGGGSRGYDNPMALTPGGYDGRASAGGSPPQYSYQRAPPSNYGDYGNNYEYGSGLLQAPPAGEFDQPPPPPQLQRGPPPPVSYPGSGVPPTGPPGPNADPTLQAAWQAFWNTFQSGGNRTPVMPQRPNYDYNGWGGTGPQL